MENLLVWLVQPENSLELGLVYGVGLGAVYFSIALLSWQTGKVQSLFKVNLLPIFFLSLIYCGFNLLIQWQLSETGQSERLNDIDQIITYSFLPLLLWPFPFFLFGWLNARPQRKEDRGDDIGLHF